MNALNIFDGPDEQSMKIGEAYGNSNNKLLKSISSSGKSMYIYFKKQYEKGKTEFKASFKYKKINFDCQRWLDVEKNILMSPNYTNNINCSWLITSNLDYNIILNFTFIEVNPFSRAVLVYFKILKIIQYHSTLITA